MLGLSPSTGRAQSGLVAVGAEATAASSARNDATRGASKWEEARSFPLQQSRGSPLYLLHRSRGLPPSISRTHLHKWLRAAFSHLPIGGADKTDRMARWPRRHLDGPDALLWGDNVREPSRGCCCWARFWGRSIAMQRKRSIKTKCYRMRITKCEVTGNSPRGRVTLVQNVTQQQVGSLSKS